MSNGYPRYFVVDGRPVKVVSATEVRAMDRETGAMVLDASAAVRVTKDEPGIVALSKDEYKRQLDALRQPILERYATANLPWTWTGDNEMPYRAHVDGHELVIREGDFPDEALYLLRIDGQEVYEIDDWPAAWTKPVMS